MQEKNALKKQRKMANKAQKEIIGYVIVGFLLLAALFGMQIMTFIFGNLGVANQGSIDDVSTSYTNVSGFFINETLSTIPEASLINFSGGFTVNAAYNSTSGELILPGNYTVNAAAGTIVNATPTNWPLVNLTYTINQKTATKIVVEETNNNSLQAINTYSEGSTTQFNVLQIVITLILLVGVFIFFWKAFMGKKGMSSGSAEGSFA